MTTTTSGRILLASAFAMTALAVPAQSLQTAYFTDQYIMRHEINPAEGNDQAYFSIPALGHVSVTTHGNFGYQEVMHHNPLYPSSSDKRMTTFMNPNISDAEALGGFSSGDNRITGDVAMTVLSAGFKAFGGYNTIALSAKTTFGLSAPYALFEFARNTGNRTYDIGDVSTHAQSYAELALGHSHQIGDRLRIGAKLKFLFGIARADLQLQDVRADLSSEQDRWTVSGTARADVSMKGFTYESETKDYNADGAGQYDRVSDISVDGAGLGGFGMAVDLGATYRISDDWKVSAALLDLGFINWTNDMRAVNRSSSFTFDGFHDTAVRESNGETADRQADKYGDQIADFINLRDDGDQGGRTTALGATVHLGCEYTLPVYRKMTFGLLGTTRIKGAYSWTEGRLSANWRPLGWLDGGVSLAVNSFTTSMGYVLNIHPRGYNFFIGMDHLLGKMSKEYIPLSSNASLTLGMSVTW